MNQQEVLNAFQKEEDICYKELFIRLHKNTTFRYDSREYTSLTTMVNRLIKNNYVILSKMIGRTAYYKLTNI